jgi:pimeloyl-ACP methyl ester carboxylesterase
VVGHSFGGRLVLELAARRPELLRCAVLLDPAIQILPHVGFDFAQEAAKEHAFSSPDEAIEARLTSGSSTPRAALEEEAREHLGHPPTARCAGGTRAQRSRPCTASSAASRRLPTVLGGMPTLLVHAEQFGSCARSSSTSTRRRSPKAWSSSRYPAATSSTGTPSSRPQTRSRSS